MWALSVGEMAAEGRLLFLKFCFNSGKKEFRRLCQLFSVSIEAVLPVYAHIVVEHGFLQRVCEDGKFVIFQIVIDGKEDFLRLLQDQRRNRVDFFR